MKIYTIKTIFLVFLISIFPHMAMAEETIPTPTKRPPILNVSPAYIEELRNRGKPQQINEIDTDFGDKQETEMINITEAKTLVDILDNTNNIIKPEIFVPRPAHKPLFPNIETSLGEDKTTLMSFFLKTEQIELDESLQDFLKTQAIKLFNENTNFEIEIHTYSTPIEGEPHSGDRISLARAFKVRSFLIKNGISPHRLKLRPMGIYKINNNSDRMDLLFIKMPVDKN